MRKNMSSKRGMTIRTESGKDVCDSGGVNKSEALSGRSMGGGKTDVSHSIGGSSAKQTGK